MNDNKTFDAEIKHGQYISQGDPELIWGWGTPAGKMRAARRAALIIDGACLAPGMRVLEIGCGNGLFTEKFAATGASILAVDLSGELLDLAMRRNLPKEHVTFLQAPFEDCDVHGPFDAVIGSSILHHLDCSKAFPKIFQLLKPGGRMSFCEPNMLNPQIWVTLNFRRFFPWISPDETAFTRPEMTGLLKGAGFQDVSVEPFDWLHPRVPKALIPIVGKGGKALEGLPGIRHFAGSLCCVGRRPSQL